MQEVNNDKSTTTGKASDSEGGDADFISLVSGISTRDCYIIANRLLILDFLLSAEALLAGRKSCARSRFIHAPLNGWAA